MTSERMIGQSRVRPVDDSADLASQVSRPQLDDLDTRELQHSQTDQAGTALRQTERRFRDMMDALPAAIYTTDAEGCLTYFNPACVEFSGRTPEIGSDHWCVTWKLFYPDGTPMPHSECPMAIALREGRTVIGAEAIAERPDGTRIWFTPYPTPLFDDAGNIIGGINMLVDITGRKKAEQAVGESEARFRMLADNINQLAWTCDTLGNVTWYNQRWLDYTGMSFEEMKGWGWSKVQHADYLAGVVKRIEHAAAAGEPWEDTFPLRGKDGNYRWFLSRALPISDERDNIVCWFGTNTDITEQRRAEEALQEADRRKDEFLATLAHELRGPLAPLRSLLDFVKRADGNGDQVLQALDTMDRQLGYMARLVDDLLDGSRISQGKIELKRQQIELAPVVNHVVEACFPLAECATHELAVTLPSEPVHLHADPMRLAQVFGNLLNNACKYTQPGGKIWLTAERQGGDVLVKVKDSGVGIPAGKLASVFEMFSQVDAFSERSQGGLGIGLTLVRRLVEMHGGTVEAFSEGPDKGTEFIVCLPAVEKPEPEEPSASPEETATMASRILVVDDHRDSAMSLAMLLQIMGNDTRTAHDGLEALEQAEAFQPHVILLDISLPNMNGYDACRRIREQPWGKDIVLVAVSGWAQEEYRVKSEEAGFNAYLVKPVEYAPLSRLLAELMVPPA